MPLPKTLQPVPAGPKPRMDDPQSVAERQMAADLKAKNDKEAADAAAIAAAEAAALLG